MKFQYRLSPKLKQGLFSWTGIFGTLALFAFHAHVYRAEPRYNILNGICAGLLALVLVVLVVRQLYAALRT